MTRSSIDRRQFLRGTIAAGAAFGLGWRAVLGVEPTGKPAPGRIGDFKISLGQWSLHDALFKGKMTNLDFPALASDRFGIEAVEFVNSFFKARAGDAAYLKALRKRADDHGVACVLILIDGEGDLGAADGAERSKAVEAHRRWVDAAAALGCHAIRVNTGSNYGPTNVEAAAEGCSKLVEYGESRNISILCENHGGPSSDPDSLLALIRRVGRPRFGTLPDFGNFPRSKQGAYTVDVYEAIARMMPHARGVSAQSHDFGPDGKETHLDFGRILKIVTDAGYHGHVAIEYQGHKLGEPEGILATKALLESLRGADYAG